MNERFKNYLRIQYLTDHVSQMISELNSLEKEHSSDDIISKSFHNIGYRLSGQIYCYLIEY